MGRPGFCKADSWEVIVERREASGYGCPSPRGIYVCFNYQPPMDENRKLKLLTEADIDRIIQSKAITGKVDMLHPLDIQLDRDYLVTIVTQSLNEMPNSPETLNIRQQRIDFLSWLNVQPDVVVLSVYPTGDDGLDSLEDELDIPDDDDQTLFHLGM